MAQAVQFPLKIGVTTQAPVYGPTVPQQVHRYRVRSHPYDVTLVLPGRDEVIGTCEVTKTGPDTFAVKPNFPVGYPTDSVRFWGGFSVDDSGVATLESVYLVPVLGH